ncbi:MAG: hypothetical protein HQK77_15570 [Desulfobacterales bacterium]|nr:hypothetical protein [Desulfobacterales bacterium]
MNSILLKQDGWIIHDKNILENEPVGMLPYKIHLEEGYTLRAYFKMLDNYPVFKKLNFFSPGFFKEYGQSASSGCSCDSLDYLEFSKIIEMIGFPGEPRLEIYNSLHGISKKNSLELKHYQLNQLLDMPVTLGKLKHIIFGDKVDQFEFDTVFNLFEFIDGIAWELSFNIGSLECSLRR